MRTHPLLARLALPAGAAFRCAERLESREGLAARFAPDLAAGPLVAEDRLRRLVEPPDGSAALQRTLSRTAPPPSASSEGGEGAVSEWLPLGRASLGPALATGSISPGRQVPRPARPSGQAMTALRSRKAPVDPRELIVPSAPEALQAILDGVAPGFPQAEGAGAKRVAKPGFGAEGRAARPRQASRDGAQTGDPAPLGRAGGNSFLLQRAAQTPVLIDEAEAPPPSFHSPGSSSPSASSTPSGALGSSAPLARVQPASKTGEGGQAPPPRVPTRSALSTRSENPVGSVGSAGSPEARELLRGSRALPALSVPSSVGGFRGLAGLAGLGDPEAAQEGEAPSPLRPSVRFDAPFPSSESLAGDAPLGRRRRFAEGLGFLGDSGVAPFGSEASADPGGSVGAGLGLGLGPLGADLEAALDHALRRAARRHGIEVLEP